MENIRRTLMNLSVFVSFIAPILILYCVDPASFNLLWKGRAFYMLFLWLVALEIVLNSDEFRRKVLITRNAIRIVFLIVAALIPVMYVTFVQVFGFSETIVNFGRNLGIPQTTFDPPLNPSMLNWLQEWSWPLSLEYAVLAILFITQIYIAYGTKGLRIFSISLFFLSAIGVIYGLDTFYPYGSGPTKPFQAIVPATAFFAARILNTLGYRTSLSMSSYYGLPVLGAYKPSVGSKTYLIGWPCAGVEGIFIYTFATLLLLKKTQVYIPKFLHKGTSMFRGKVIWLSRGKRMPKLCEQTGKKALGLLTEGRFLAIVASVGYFTIGAIGTYIVNAFRIATIFVIGITQGDSAASTFHDVYGGLFTSTWIIFYMIMLMIVFRKKR